MYFHYQNLNDAIPKKYALHGRCWIGNSPQIHLSWTLPSKDFSLKLGFVDWEDVSVSFHISLWLFALWISFEWQPLTRLLQKITKRKDLGYSNGRSIGVAWYASTLWIDLWNDPMESRSKDPKWWHLSIDFDRLLKGKATHSEEVVEEREILVPMPEKAYPATAKRIVRRWTYPRWFMQERMDVQIEIPGGIPFEGKGENSWDCGQDAVFSSSMSAKSITEAVGNLVGSVLRDRVKNGGWKDWNWQKPNP